MCTDNIVSLLIQLLRGSHKCGRIEHVTIGEQNGCDVDRVKEIMDVCPHQYMEMDPGMWHV